MISYPGFSLAALASPRADSSVRLRSLIVLAALTIRMKIIKEFLLDSNNDDSSLLIHTNYLVRMVSAGSTMREPQATELSAFSSLAAVRKHSHTNETPYSILTQSFDRMVSAGSTMREPKATELSAFSSLVEVR